MRIRDAVSGDVAFLRRMLYEAAFWRPESERPPLEVALAQPELRPYVDGWGRAGDRGLLAIEAGRPLGAAWYRFFASEAPGRGFLTPEVPELTIAVVRERRSEGIGSTLLSRLIDCARADVLVALTLSVEPDNPARRLYERAGFVKVAEDGAWTMRLDIS
jgi:GNAT superfamily N-acetyltransferase